jgi:hypothetical protein
MDETPTQTDPRVRLAHRIGDALTEEVEAWDQRPGVAAVTMRADGREYLVIVAERPPASATGESQGHDVPAYEVARSSVVETFTRWFVEHALYQTRGNVSAASRAGNMDRSYLIKLAKQIREGDQPADESAAE